LQGYSPTVNNPFLNWPFIDIFWYKVLGADPSVGRYTAEVVELSAPTLQSLMDDGRKFDVGADMCDTVSSQQQHMPNSNSEQRDGHSHSHSHSQGQDQYQDLDQTKGIIIK
jgi:hypothetical protein